MSDPQRFLKGTNISHWTSQTDLADLENRRTRFTGVDVERIKSFGMDHLRLPFDYALLENDATPGQYAEDGFGWIEKCLDWCGNAGLNVILDMHRAPGACFSEENNPLYDDEEYLDRFTSLWRAIAQRLNGRGPALALELLNEATAKDPEDWNRVAGKALEAIRSADTERTVFIGSNLWNACKTFDQLQFFGDPNVIYTFHFYHPFIFTHQRASWVHPQHEYYTESVPYPGRPPGLQELLERVPDEHRAWAEDFVRVSDVEMNRDLLEECLQPVLTFRDKHDVTIYCGEFGALAVADDESRRAWYTDILALFNKHSIGWSNWDYQGGFGLIDSEKEPTVVHEVLVGRAGA